MSDYSYRRDRTPASISWSRISEPTYELITVAEARHHLRLESYGGDDDIAEDAYLTDLIAAAGDTIETHTRRPIRDQQRELIIKRETLDGYTHQWNYDGWFWSTDGAIVLNTTPIRSVDSITYMEDGETRTQPPAGRVVTGLGEGIARNVEIYPLDGESWPWLNWTWGNDSDIRIAVTCGYTQDNLPRSMKHAARLMVNDWYSLRGQTLVGTISAKVGRSLDYLLAQHTREVFR